MAATRILIAQPTSGQVLSGTVGYMMGLAQFLSARGIGWEYRNVAMANLPLSRNIFASYLVAEPQFTHLLFIDSDMGFLPETILGLVRFDSPVTAVACPKRFLAWDRLRRVAEAEALARPQEQRRPTQDLVDQALAYNVSLRRFDGSPWTAERRGGFLRVPGVGTGIMLIRRDACEAMLQRGVARRRTGYGDLPLIGTAPLCDFFSPIETPDGSVMESEDLSFCKRWVEDCGGEIWVDIASRVQHFGTRGHAGRYLPRALVDFDLAETTALNPVGGNDG